MAGVQIFFRHGARTPIHHLPGEEKEPLWSAPMCQSLPDLERTLRITGLDGGPRPISLTNERQVWGSHARSRPSRPPLSTPISRLVGLGFSYGLINLRCVPRKPSSFRVAATWVASR